MAAPGKSGDRQTDRPSVRLARLPLGPGATAVGARWKTGLGRAERGRDGYASAQSLGPPLGAAGEIPGPHLGPFRLDVTGTVIGGVPAGVEVTDSGD